MRCGSQAPSSLLEEDGLARPVVDVEELEVIIGKLRGDQVGDDVECAGQLRARAGDTAQDLPRVVDDFLLKKDIGYLLGLATRDRGFRRWP